MSSLILAQKDKSREDVLFAEQAEISGIISTGNDVWMIWSR
jgi:hypothetical protein